MRLSGRILGAFAHRTSKRAGRSVALAGLLLAGCYDSSFGEASGNGAAQSATLTIRQLCDICTGTTFSVTGDIVVAGTVTTSDAEGNFYRSLCIEDQGAGLEIMAGIDRLHNDYPVGCRVMLRLKGLAVGRSRGVLQIGRMPAAGSGYATDYIGSKPALDAAIVRTDTDLQPHSPAVLRIAELTPAACGRLVRIDRLRYAPEELSTATWAGYKRFTDETGAEIHTYVRTYARFANEEVGAGYRSLTGILQREDSGRYLLKPRDEADLFY